MAILEETRKSLAKAKAIPRKVDRSAHASNRELLAAGIAFIFTDGNGKVEPAKRKLIRRHVMMGRNRGKPRSVKALERPALRNPKDSSQHEDGVPGLVIRMHHFMIPDKVGSDLSFTQFAATVEPVLIHDILKFAFTAKKIMYPLESCIVFHRKTKIDTAWFELLTSDAAYVHAAVFASQAYILISSAQKTPVAARRAMEHHSAALRLLRERLSVPNSGDKVSDATILVVLYLALHAHFTNDYDTAKHHMEGLRKIADMRGGLVAFGYNTKLVMELLNGTEPYFFNDPFSEPPMPYDLAPLTVEAPDTSAANYWNPTRLGINSELAEAWDFLTRFCSIINAAAENKRQLGKETLLNAMASSMYRLLHMKYFDPTSIDEAIRLGLLAFSSHIFLTWQGIRLPHPYLPNTYRTCLLNLKLPGTFPPQILLWLLIVGSFSVFTSSDAAWLAPWVRANIELCEASTWTEVRGQLKTFPWIDILHDKPVQAIYESAI
ncbi:uncharacterized protein A1O9_05341 [Exophiala aquamarina CBS 119918]|uniref:Uncharacterized protein n=1 Tax=Exophiala aquamarina CBS 119918 TaxID=1182545 RepID=A0A072PBE6_9EURO|nr:uncharacterized protein A1O9_05341 [Exophiala aquamarina CBS 119918]KEF57424.1 hypothetical protein A1O9_05341 [Exophiala aquamarina CBS 119918]